MSEIISCNLGGMSVKKIKWLSLFMVVTLLIISLGLSTTAAYKDGTYEGSAPSMAGTLKVKVTVKDGEITKIDVVDNPDTPILSDMAIEHVNEAILKDQNWNVDSASGATVTSTALKQAVKTALAGAVVEGVTKTSKNVVTKKSYETDVLVVGAGGAGLSAAITAHDTGAKVLVIEKMPIVGGNTIRAEGGLNAAGTKLQKAKGIEDSAELFYEDTMKGGKNINQPDLVKILTTEAKLAVDWLTGLGADLSDVGQLAGAAKPRAHRPTGGFPVGSEVIKTLYKSLKDRNIELLTSTKATELIVNNGKVIGAKALQGSNEITIKAKAVVIATGGFGANNDLVASIKPALKGFGTTNHTGATGDGINMAKAIGASLIDIDQIQTHPTVVPGNGIMITEAVRGNGAILVNREGQRFISELETRDVVSEAILKQTGKTAFLIFEQNVRESLKTIESYIKQGLLVTAETPEELAKKLNINGNDLVKTIDRYNSFVTAGKDSDFKRNNLPRKLDKPGFYAIEVGPAVHHTMGGLKINTKTQVLNEKGTVIPGIYAAGEVVGGVHGANRLGGNAVADIVVFGRIAGSEAAAAVK